eukprot:UN21331
MYENNDSSYIQHVYTETFSSIRPHEWIPHTEFEIYVKYEGAPGVDINQTATSVFDLTKPESIDEDKNSRSERYNSPPRGHIRNSRSETFEKESQLHMQYSNTSDHYVAGLLTPPVSSNHT